MWISPNHPDPPKQYQAPNDEGVSLGTFARGDGGEELRVSVKSYENHPYVSVRLWSRDDRGDWWPAKNKGISIRLAEVEGVIGALQGAFRAAHELKTRGDQAEPKRRGQWGSPAQQRQEGHQGTPGRARGDRGASGRPPWQETPVPKPEGRDGSAFDEFSE